MSLQKLYRYVNKWNHIPNEHQQALQFLKEHADKSELKEYIIKTKNSDLYKKLYFANSEINPPILHLPEKSQMHPSLDALNNTHHYLTLNRNYHFIFHHIVSLLHIIYPANIHPSYHLELLAYKILILFYNEKIGIEGALNHFELYLQSQQFDPSIAPSKLLPDLSTDEKNTKINLAAWQQILETESLASSFPLFFIAATIEEKLQRAPINLEEAKQAALAIRYQYARFSPEFADFCVGNFIPEAYYNGVISSNASQRYRFQFLILEHIPLQQHTRYVTVLPLHDEATAKELLNLAEHLTPDAQISFITLHGNKIIQSLEKNLLDFDLIFSKIKYPYAQTHLIITVGKEKLNQFLDKFPDLIYFIKNMHADCKPFFWGFIGKNKFNQLISTPHLFEQFLEHCLPTSNQVKFLIDNIGVEPIRGFSSLYYLLGYLKKFNTNERLAFLVNIIGKEKLHTLIDSWYNLKAILRWLAPNDCYTLLFETLDKEKPRSIIQSNIPILNEMSEFLPADKRNNISELLVTNEEIAAREQVYAYKNQIMSIEFKTGIFGIGGGTNIVIDNGTTKKVPTHIANIWYHIQLAIETNQFLPAIAQIKKEGVDLAKNKSLFNGAITYFTRHQNDVYQNLKPTTPKP